MLAPLASVARRTIDDVLAEAQARLRRLTPREAHAAMADGWLLVDIRSADALRSDGAVPGAIHIPLSVLEWRVDPSSGHQDPRIRGREDRIVLLCADGCSSSLAAVRLHDLGFRGTTDVIGGFAAWRAEVLPVERAADGT